MDNDKVYDGDIIFAMNKMTEAAHQLAKDKGWFDDPETDHQFVTRTVANIHGEVSEFWEAERNGKLNELCDKASKMVTPLTCAEEELADIIIRVFDTAQRLGVDIGKAVIAKHEFNKTRPYRHGGKKA